MFHLPTEQLYTVSRLLMSLTGFWFVPVCKPFTTAEDSLGPYGRCLRLCFFFLGPVFEFVRLDLEMVIVLVAVFLMTPTVFFSLQRMFDWGDILYDRLHTWLSPTGEAPPTGWSSPPK